MGAVYSRGVSVREAEKGAAISETNALNVPAVRSKREGGIGIGLPPGGVAGIAPAGTRRRFHAAGESVNCCECR
jgi:hypothetical protein